MSSALRPYALALLLALVSAVAAIAVASAYHLPWRDPDGIAGPAYLRLPGVIVLLILLDVVPRALHRRVAIRAVLRERYGPERTALVAAGLATFYVTYVSYRNLKGALPLARPRVLDPELLDLDRFLVLGNEPSVLLHDLLGTGLIAHLLSGVYLGFLGFVPLSLGIALVWSRSVRIGCWYVTAMCVNWSVGALSYYLVPSLGPVFVRPDLYAGLPATGASHLQASLAEARLEVLANPTGADAIAGVAGFASLHVSITTMAVLIAFRIGLPRVVRWSLVLFGVATVTATLYFGWHYLVDDVAGFALGVASVDVAERATRVIGVRRADNVRVLTPAEEVEEPAAAA